MESETSIIRKYEVVLKIPSHSSDAESILYETLKATDKLIRVLIVELFKLNTWNLKNKLKKKFNWYSHEQLILIWEGIRSFIQHLEFCYYNFLNVLSLPTPFFQHNRCRYTDHFCLTYWSWSETMWLKNFSINTCTH